MSKAKFFVACALCALTTPGLVGNARAQETKPATTTQPLMRTLIDRDANRSIEIVTDRHESVAQFFQRQKLAIAIAPTLNGKPVSNAELAKTTTTAKIFVSYPLENDHDMTIRLYGAFFSLAPVSQEVRALFDADEDANPPKTRTMLIFAPIDTTKIEDTTAPARLVGRVRIFDGGNWLPGSEKSALVYAPVHTKN